MNQISIDNDINWEKLREQKRIIIANSTLEEEENGTASYLKEVINLICNVQSRAVICGAQTHAEVFG